MASLGLHSCCYLAGAFTNRALSSFSTSTTNRTNPPPCPTRLGRRSSPSSTSSSSFSSSWTPIRVDNQLQSDNASELGHLQKRADGRKRAKHAEDSEESQFSPSSAATSEGLLSVYKRRDIIHLGAATAALVGAQMVGVGGEEATAVAAAEGDPVVQATPPKPSTMPVVKDEKADTTITDKVYLDLTICPSASRSDRTLGNTSQLCTDGEPLGRIVIGLYGRLVPQTVKNFKAMITGAAGPSYAGTIFHRVLAGQYIQGGRQGSRDKGEVSGALYKLDSNQETVSSKSYKLVHNRPGTVSLALAENDDEEDLKLDVDYRNVQFLITTGPGPAPQLDNGNIVLGTVMEGLDVVAAVASVPTYRPSEKIRQFNDFASFLGDERAANARNFWDRPLKTVVIRACGEIPLGLPVFPTGLP